MKKLTLLIASCCFALAIYAQTEDTLVKQIETAYKAVQHPDMLKTDKVFMDNLKQVIARADASSAYVMDKYSTFIYMNGLRDDVGVALERMPEEVKQSEMGQRVQDMYNRMMTVRVGDKVPNICLPTPEGATVALYDYIKGKKIVLIDFWASWCAPCRKEAVNVKAIYEQYHDRGFDVYAVSLDTKAEAWKKAIADDGMPWVQVSDLKGWKTPMTKWFNFTSIPCMFVVDGEGTILARDLRGDALKSKVEELCK